MKKIGEKTVRWIAAMAKKIPKWLLSREEHERRLYREVAELADRSDEQSQFWEHLMEYFDIKEIWLIFQAAEKSKVLR